MWAEVQGFWESTGFSQDVRLVVRINDVTQEYRKDMLNTRLSQCNLAFCLTPPSPAGDLIVPLKAQEISRLNFFSEIHFKQGKFEMKRDHLGHPLSPIASKLSKKEISRSQKGFSSPPWILCLFQAISRTTQFKTTATLRYFVVTLTLWWWWQFNCGSANDSWPVTAAKRSCPRNNLFVMISHWDLLWPLYFSCILYLPVQTPLLCSIFSIVLVIFKQIISFTYCTYVLLLLFWPYHTACRIFVTWPGIKPMFLQWKCRVLTTGPPRKSLFIMVSLSVLFPSILPVPVSFTQWFIPPSVGKESYLPAMQETQEKWVQSLSQEDPLEEGIETHSSIFAWSTPWTEEPGRLQSIGTQSQTQLERLSMHVCTPKNNTWYLEAVH